MRDTSASQSGLVRYALDGDVSVIRLEAPERHNALGPDMVAQVRYALEASADARSIVLEASGRHFCSGGDHDALKDLNEARVRSFVSEIRGLFSDIASSPAPVVVSMHGGVIGGGLELALRCDLMVASSDTWFELPQAELGVPIGRETLELLTRRCGLGTARRMVLLGARLDAEAAARVGLIDVLVSHPRHDETALQVAKRLAGLPAGVLARMRREFAACLGQPTDAGR